MAYAKFDLFKNLGQGSGTPPVYGPTPRTFTGDLALVTRCPGYSKLRRVNAQVQGQDTLLDVTIWVGLKSNEESVDDASLSYDSGNGNVVEWVALACPPFIQELKEFKTEEEIINSIEAVLIP